MNLQSVSINVRTLRLTSQEVELSFLPFSVELSNSSPYCCVIGPSGSGKTTFFKSLIPRFIKDWQNHVSVEIGIDINRNQLDFFSTNGRIGYAAQKPFFVAHHTVRSNLVEPFRWSGKVEPTRAVIDNLIIDFALEKIVDRKAYQLSAGERQCVNLARMFIASPELAIIDECFSSMDETLADKIARIIVDKYSSNTRIFITSHRKKDLALFMPKMLKFSSSDRIDEARQKQVREVKVEYNELP